MRATLPKCFWNSNYLSFKNVRCQNLQAGRSTLLIWICYIPNIQTELALSNGQMTCVRVLRRVALAALMMNTSSTSINRSTKTKTPTRSSGGFWGCNSLTMSYFHTGTRTIIGAKSFHGPVRDGKEWYQLAMVIRHNLLSPWLGQGNEFIEQYQIYFECVTWHNFLDQ